MGSSCNVSGWLFLMTAYINCVYPFCGDGKECYDRCFRLDGFAVFRGEFANCGCQAKDILLGPRSDVSSENNARSKEFFPAPYNDSRHSV